MPAIEEFLCGAVLGTALTLTACYIFRPPFVIKESKDRLVRDFVKIIATNHKDPVKSAFLRSQLGKVPKL